MATILCIDDDPTVLIANDALRPSALLWVAPP